MVGRACIAPHPRQGALWASPHPRGVAWAHTRKTRPAAGREGGREGARRRGPGPIMQPLDVGSIPAEPGEPRLTRWLRKGSGILAHLVALSFTLFLTLLSRPGTSEWARKAGGMHPGSWGVPPTGEGFPLCAQSEAVGGALGAIPWMHSLLEGRFCN